MLERLFGSASRSKIIKFFCTQGSDSFYMRELARQLDIKVSALSRELDNLEKLGLLTSSIENNKKYYSVNQSFPLLIDLQQLIAKSVTLLEKAIIKNLQSLKGVQALFLTGIFNGQPTDTDILIVGSVDRMKVQRLVSSLSRSYHQDVRFTIFSTSEYKYRAEVTDKFLYKILNLSPIVIVNKIKA